VHAPGIAKTILCPILSDIKLKGNSRIALVRSLAKWSDAIVTKEHPKDLK
jgi:hypothetical protein